MTLLQPELIAQLAAHVPRRAWRGGTWPTAAELTLRDWHRRSNRLARGLRAQGLGRDDRVGLLLSNDEPLEWLVSYLAIHKAGAVAVPLLARLGPVELARILQDAGASRGPVQRGQSRRSGPRSGRWCPPDPAARCGGPTCSLPTIATWSRRTARRHGRHHVHLGDHRTSQGSRRPARWAFDDRTACPRPGWGSASSLRHPSPRPAGRSSSRAPCAAG